MILAGAIAVCFISAPAFGEDGGASQTGNIGQAIAAVAVFALLMFGLGKWAWKPIIAQIRQREETVAKTIERADKRRVEAEDILAEYNQRLQQANQEIEQMKVAAMEEAATAHDDLLREARDDANKHYEQVKTAIEKARREALRDLYDQTAGIATEMAGKIIGRNLDTQVHRKMVEDSLAEIRAHISENKE